MRSKESRQGDNINERSGKWGGDIEEVIEEVIKDIPVTITHWSERLFMRATYVSSARAKTCG